MSIASWFKNRLGMGPILDHLIPDHANTLSFVLGGIILVLGLAQGITGILLQQVYEPMPDENAAYSSVLYMTQHHLWNFVRNMHYWGSQSILVLVYIHMIRAYVSGSYKKPRELLWVSGVVLLVTVWLLSFSGSVLKWDQEGVEALGHNLELTNYLGPFGYWFSPEFAHQIPFLVRMNSAHVTILPVFALVLVGLHLYLLRIHGMSSQSGAPLAERQVPYSIHFKKMILYGTIAVGIIMVISAIVSAPLSTLGNPKIEVTKPDWYMLWVYAIEDLGGLQVVPYILAPAIIIMLLVPFIDRNPETSPAKRKLMMALLVAALLLYVGMTVFAATTPPQSHLGMMK